jgi:chitosanase
MNDLQKKTVQAIVNIFETGRVAGDYGAVTLLKGDPGHLTYGRSQTTLASGYLFLLIKSYCDRDGAQFAARLSPFLPKLSARDLELDNDFNFRELLREAATDPLMQSEQDRFFDDHFLNPSCRTAQAKGIASALGHAVVYDGNIQGGFAKVASSVGLSIGDGGVPEHDWILKYIAARKRWLASLNPPLPSTTYRMDSFARLANDNAWDLPLDLTVRGVTITPANLADSTPTLRASAVDASDPEPGPLIHLTSPYMSGEDVRRVQEALNANGFTNNRDGVYGPFAEALVKKFQSSRQLRPDGVVGPATRAALGL